MTTDDLDPKGLIREAFRIEGIGPAECRSIFLDWALGMPLGADVQGAVRALLDRHGAAPGHPMTATLQAALDDPGPARRRGGRAGRLRD